MDLVSMNLQYTASVILIKFGDANAVICHFTQNYRVKRKMSYFRSRINHEHDLLSPKNAITALPILASSSSSIHSIRKTTKKGTHTLVDPTTSWISEPVTVITKRSIMVQPSPLRSRSNQLLDEFPQERRLSTRKRRSVINYREERAIPTYDDNDEVDNYNNDDEMGDEGSDDEENDYKVTEENDNNNDDEEDDDEDTYIRVRPKKKTKKNAQTTQMKAVSSLGRKRKKTSNETTTTTNKNKKRSSSIAGPKTTGLDEDEIRSSMNFFKDDPTQLQDHNNLRSTMIDNWKSIKNELIEIGGEHLGIIDNRLDDYQDFEWFMEPMVDMVAGQPISKNGLKKALIVGNYPKPTLSKRDNDRTGLKGMFEKVQEEDAIDSESRFRNPSVDQLRSIFGEFGPSESVTCEVIEELFIAIDIFLFQCFYRANIPRLLDVMKDKFPVFYKSYIAYTKYEFQSIAKALLRAGQKPSETPLFTLGTAPYEELTKERGHFHFLLDIFKYPVQTCHPCSLLDPNSTCGLPRFKESDEALTQVSCFITGNENMVITYHQRFYDKHKPTIQAVLKRRLRTSFGGIDESDCQKRTHYTADDKLWSEKLILAQQYAIDHDGRVPKSVPRRLRKILSALSTKE